ncbi:MAG TPA: hypothetical protein VK475_04120 [Pyrinomonadaceae bacterium]|nr:hypothetical protein [Pyrinomonadaceae bacterium]
MKKISIKTLALSVVLTMGGVAVADTPNDVTTLKQINGYREWIRLNQQPVLVIGDAGI